MMLSTFFKWLAIVNAGVQLFKAYQGFVLQQGATGSGRRVGQYLEGDQAVQAGWLHLGAALVFGLIAFAIWFWWERNED